MSRQLDRRTDGLAAFKRLPGILWIGFARQITKRPTVKPASLENIDPGRGHIVAQVVAIIVGRPDLAGLRKQSHPNRVAEPGREPLLARPIEIVPCDRCALGVTLVAQIAARAYRNKHLVAPEDH